MANFCFSPKSILYWPGYTVRTPESVVRDLACPLEEFTAFAQRMKERFNTPLKPFPDMAASLNVPVATIISHTLRGNPKTQSTAYQHVVWLASRAAFHRLAAQVAEQAASAANRHDVAVADNLTYQGNIIAAGLLMVDDFVHAGRAALEFPQRFPNEKEALTRVGELFLRYGRSRDRKYWRYT